MSTNDDTAAQAGPAEGAGSAGPHHQSMWRLIGFTDAVVAIAITLIVLPLVDSARSSTSGTALDFLIDNALNLFAAALSFVVIASFWRDHHRLYRYVTGSNALLVNANLLWLAGIVFLPLPTILIVDSPGHDPVAAGLYIGTILLTEIAVRLQEIVIVRCELLPPERQPDRRSVRADWITVGLTFAALLVTLFIPQTGLYPLLIVLLARPINWLVRRRTPAEDERRRIL